jgi:Holliday junction DNA helicase RuvA
MYSESTKIIKGGLAPVVKTSLVIEETQYIEEEVGTMAINHHEIMNDTLMACKELGFREDKIIPIAQKILGANLITKPEQLIHLVLKEL